MSAIRTQKGFTLIELLVVVLIIGILAAIAVPQYFKVVEKGRFAEANNCFATLKGGQERYLLKNNAYAASSTSLDTDCPTLKYYSAPGITGASASAWTGLLTRANPTPTAYGAYVVTFTMPTGTYACSQTACSNDLLP